MIVPWDDLSPREKERVTGPETVAAPDTDEIEWWCEQQPGPCVCGHHKPA